MLGHLEIVEAGQPLNLGGRKQRILLAMLTMRRDVVVTREALIDAVWPESPPTSAPHTIHAYISRLRAVMREAGVGNVIYLQSGGYRLDLRGHQLDWDEFRRLAADGRQCLDAGDHQRTIECLGQALELWRGPALGELSNEASLSADAKEMNETRLEAVECWAEAQLAVGRSEGVIARLRGESARFPTRERLQELLMLALYRGGGQAEALDTFRAFQTYLRDQLGLEPSSGLKKLQLQVLQRDPAIDGAAPVGTGSGTSGRRFTRALDDRSGSMTLPVPPAVEAGRTRLVGRSDEMAELAERGRSMLDGGLQLVVVEGDAGIGKTALACEAASQLLVPGPVMYGRCNEHSAIPFEPWTQVVQDIISGAPVSLLEKLADGVGAELARIAPEFRERVPGIDAPLRAHPDTERWRLFESVARLLELVGSGMLILDDLHWADRSSLLLLRHVVRRRSEAKLLVVGTYRGAELTSRSMLEEALSDLRRELSFSTIAMKGLSRDEVERLVAEARPLRATVVDALYRQTEGNPFFIGEIMRNLPDGDGDPGFRIPQGVRDAIDRRLSNLSASSRELLATASVIGRDFDLDLLREVVRLGTDDLVSLLDEAIERQVITEIGVGRYSFIHALIQATLYDGLSLTRRARLHHATGLALEANPSNGPLSSADLAHHFWLAAADESQRVVSYAQSAARASLDQLSYDEAVAHARRALEVLEESGDAGTEVELGARLLLGEAQSRAGSRSDARATFRIAAQLALSQDDPVRLAQAALGFAGPDWESFGTVDGSAIELLQAALAVLDLQPSALRAQVLARLAIARYFNSSPEDVAKLAADAVNAARVSQSAPALVASLQAQLYSMWRPDGLRKRDEIAREMLALAETERLPEAEEMARSWLIIGHLEAGELELAWAEIDRHRESAATLREQVVDMYSTVFSTLRALAEGRYAEAHELATAVIRAGEDRGTDDALQFVGIHAVTFAHDLGTVGAFAGALRAHVTNYPAVPTWRLALAYTLAENKDTERARTELAAANPIALPRDANWLPGMAFAALTCRHLRDAPLARDLRRALEPYRERCVLLGAAALWGTVDRYLGILSMACGDHVLAAESFERAVRRDDAMGLRVWAAHDRMELAGALAALNDARASGLRSQAQAELERLVVLGEPQTSGQPA